MGCKVLAYIVSCGGEASEKDNLVLEHQKNLGSYLWGSIS